MAYEKKTLDTLVSLFWLNFTRFGICLLEFYSLWFNMRTFCDYDEKLARRIFYWDLFMIKYQEIESENGKFDVDSTLLNLSLFGIIRLIQFRDFFDFSVKSPEEL